MAQRGGSTFTEDNANFFRYSSMLLDLGAEVLRNVFQIYLGQTKLKQFMLNNKPKLDSLLNKNILGQHQFDLLFPQQGDPDLSKYDITLMFCLLRNLNSNVRAGDLKWTQPTPQDTSLEADVGRIRVIRNRLHGHVNSTSMSVLVFQKEKTDLESLYVRLVQKVPSSPDVTLTAKDVKDEIKKLSEEALEPARQERLLHSINAWYAVDLPQEISQLRDRISEGTEDVKETVSECTDDVKQTIDNVVSPLKAEIADVKTDLHKLSYDIESEMDSMVDKRLLKRRIYDSKIEIEEFIETTKEYHLELASFTEARDTLQTNNRLILTGYPGAGKSHMAMTLLKRLSEEGNVSPVIVREGEEWEKLVDPDKHVCVFIDDFLGKFKVDVKENNIWQNLVPAIKVYTKSGKTQFIATMRTGILEEIKLTYGDSKILELFGSSVIDLSSEKYKMKIKEKEMMIVKYSKTLDINKADMTSICKGEEIIGFPQCCKLLTDCLSNTLVLSIFQHPVEYLVREIENLLSSQPLKYSVLSLTLLLGGTMRIAVLNDSEAVASRILNICGLEAKEVLVIPEAAKSLSVSGAFLKYNENDENYIFAHDTIHEAVFTSFVRRFPKETLEYSSMDLISRACTLKDHTSNPKSSKDTDGLSESSEIVVQVKHLPVLIQRFKEVVQSRNSKGYANVTKSKLWLQTRFQREMVKSLDSPGLVVAKDNQGESLLVHAVRAGNLPCVTTLLSAMETPYCCDNTENTKQKQLALQTACKCQNLSIVRVLVEVVPSVSNDVMFEAAIGGDVSVMEELISHHGNILCERNNGYTLVHCACRYGKLELVKLLVCKLIELYEIEIHANYFLSSTQNKYRFMPLHMAAISGNVDLVKFILDSGVQPTVTNIQDKANVLHIACQFEHLELVKYLLNRCPELLDIPDGEGKTPLHCAAMKGHLEVLQYLVLQEADVKVKTTECKNLIHQSCCGKSGNIEMLQYLILQFPWMMEEEDDNGETPIHTAAAYGLVDEFDCLCTAGANIEHKTKNNNTILHGACTGQNTAAVLQYISLHYPMFYKEVETSRFNDLYTSVKAGNVKKFERITQDRSSINMRTRTGKSLLHLAVEHKQHKIIEHIVSKKPHFHLKIDVETYSKLHIAANEGAISEINKLVTNGADIRCKTLTGRNVLHVASRAGHLDIVKYLLDYCDELLSECDLVHNTPLHDAVLSGSVDVIRYLVGAGADVRARGLLEASPLHLASFNGHLKIVEFLVEFSPDLMKEKDKHSTPIIIAALGGHVNVVKYLAQAGANIRSLSVGNLTILHCACHSKNIDIVKYLITAYPDLLDKEDDAQRTPLHCAATYGKVKIVELLVGAGAKLECRNKWGETPLECARQKNHDAVVEYLETCLQERIILIKVHQESDKSASGVSERDCTEARGASTEDVTVSKKQSKLTTMFKTIRDKMKKKHE